MEKRRIMTKKVQITLTLGEDDINYLQIIADGNYDGNISMAARSTMKYHKLKVNYKK